MNLSKAIQFIQFRRRDFLSIGPIEIKCLHISENLWREICEDAEYLTFFQTAEKGNRLAGYPVFRIVEPDIFEVIPNIGIVA